VKTLSPPLSCAQPSPHLTLTIILLSANTHNLKRERRREKTIKIENLKLQEKENN